MKWTILVTVNDGYFDFFQNWLHFYRKLHLNYRLIVIAEDDIVFFKLQQLDGNLITLEKSRRNSSREAVVYGSEAFSELASARPTYILKYLQNRVNIVYADIDAVWLRNPFPYFNGSFDMWMQSDGPKSLCTGLMAIKSSNDTIKLMLEWEASLKKHLQIDQSAFNKVVKYSKARLKTLDTNLFPSGRLYFKEFKDNQRSNVVIVHNNFIKGHPAKLQRFKTYKLWYSQ
ncbi:uncharacterized protein LOC123529260 [Mercenaria mercenaria]|uniref:uncharacterized protein LOC123529260 n=1 Tax=Mercenaria mercenaria TaxID=6596 RepID=UPI00234E83F1|nr:uncharacterized protein LOC123529260 [Mercenaria mercenaria]